MRTRSYIIGSIVILFGLIGWGLYLTSRPSRAIPYRPPVATSTPIITDSASTTPESENSGIKTSTGSSTTATPSPAPNNSAACAEDLWEQTRATNTEYERGSILVGFTSDVNFATAMGILTKYDVRVLNTTNAETNYPSLRLITATVNDNQEFIKICALRGNAKVRYADLNKLVSLHD
ncbi:MAG: hypothetical protein V4519_05035 [Patescibacteria group bacterium]